MDLKVWCKIKITVSGTTQVCTHWQLLKEWHPQRDRTLLFKSNSCNRHNTLGSHEWLWVGRGMFHRKLGRTYKLEVRLCKISLRTWMGPSNSSLLMKLSTSLRIARGWILSLVGLTVLWELWTLYRLKGMTPLLKPTILLRKHQTIWSEPRLGSLRNFLCQSSIKENW